MASISEGLAGEEHDGWFLESMLGQPGAFSVVYAARPAAGGQLLALKVLKPERGIDPGVAFEFEREGSCSLNYSAHRMLSRYTPPTR